MWNAFSAGRYKNISLSVGVGFSCYDVVIEKPLSENWCRGMLRLLKQNHFLERKIFYRLAAV